MELASEQWELMRKPAAGWSKAVCRSFRLWAAAFNRAQRGLRLRPPGKVTAQGRTEGGGSPGAAVGQVVWRDRERERASRSTIFGVALRATLTAESLRECSRLETGGELEG